MAQTKDDELLTQKAASEFLGVSRHALYKLRTIAYLQYTPRGRRYYRRSDLVALQAKSLHQPAA